jgi:hypothetical protein
MAVKDSACLADTPATRRCFSRAGPIRACFVTRAFILTTLMCSPAINAKPLSRANLLLLSFLIETERIDLLDRKARRGLSSSTLISKSIDRGESVSSNLKTATRARKKKSLAETPDLRVAGPVRCSRIWQNNELVKHPDAKGCDYES